MSRFLHRILSSFFPSVCLSDLSDINWEGHTLRCPSCGKLLAYAFPLHDHYEIHITYQYKQNPVWSQRISDTLPVWLKSPPPKEPIVEIQWELLREPIEPLASDSWDNEEAYQEYIKEQIAKNQYGKEDDLNGKSE